jgi:chromate transporter
MTGSSETAGRASPSRLVLLSLLLGITGFGGGYAVAQRLRKTLVDERGWLDEHSFMEAFAAATALPGTAATNLLTILGMRLGGVGTAVLCAVSFLTPSVVLMIGFGALYDSVRGVGGLSAFLDGMAFATVGVVAAVAVEMRKSAIADRTGWGLALGAAAALSLRALNLLEVVLIAGVVGMLVLRPRASVRERAVVQDDPFPPSSLRSFAAPLPALLALSPQVLALFLVFARIGIATFGGGFAMIAPIEHEVVVARGWLDAAAFNDAMVLGQITPGPVAIAATFIGYRVSGLAGALLATVGMFGPPMALAIVVGRSLDAFRASALLQGFLRGVAPAVVGIIAASAISLGRTSLHGWLDWGTALATFAALLAAPRLSPLAPLATAGLVSSVARAFQQLPFSIARAE